MPAAPKIVNHLVENPSAKKITAKNRGRTEVFQPVLMTFVKYIKKNSCDSNEKNTT